MILQANFPHEHRHENPQQNINKANLVTYKIVIPHDQVEFIPGVQDWFTIQKTTAVYLYIIWINHTIYKIQYFNILMKKQEQNETSST